MREPDRVMPLPKIFRLLSVLAVIGGCVASFAHLWQGNFLLFLASCVVTALLCLPLASAPGD